MSTTKIEFAVEMTCQKCVDAVRSSLAELDGINNVDVSLDKGTVIVETDLPCSLIQQKIESSGRRSVLKGYGEEAVGAVSVLGGNSGHRAGDQVKGVVRFARSLNTCVADGTIDGLSPGSHSLRIHEYGDISEGCKSVGELYDPCDGAPDNQDFKRRIGDLGDIAADENGRATFRLKIDSLRVPDIIGRSLVITEKKKNDLDKGDDVASNTNGNSENRLACGIIARSSGVFQNAKKICACDGLTLWEERRNETRGK